MKQDHINEQLSYTWLQDGQLFPETEGFMLAIQDQVIATRNYKKYIIKDPSVADDNCRKCHQQKETIDHITSGCRTLAGTEYIARHNSAAKVIHQALATTNQLIENNDPYYNYTPTSVLENNQYKLYWDVEIHTDKTIPANRPDIVFQSKADRVTYLIDIAIPNDKNIQNTYTGKISKYTDLAIEIKRLWKQNKVIIVPLIMSVSGLTPNTFTPHLKQLGLDENWLTKTLQIYKINPGLRQFLTRTMETWRTSIHLKTQDGQIQTDELHIRRGTFQGDSLSSLWFCLCLNPLSNALKGTKCGFKIRNQKVDQHRINHLLYMDDIKLYAATEVQLRELIRITEACTSDIGMEFGLNKCKVLHVNRGQWINHPEHEIVNGQALDNIDKDETYKYLGFNQNVKINHTQVKTQLTQEFRDRLTKLLKTQLNSKNLTKAINTFAIPVLTYSFGIIKWSHTDIENINILIRTELTKHRMSHPNACKERLTIDRKQGGRGIIDIQSLHSRQIKSLRQFFQSKQTNLHRAIVKADKNYTPLSLSRSSHAADAHNHIQSQQVKIDTWSQKALHGKHRYRVTQDYVNEQQSYTWLHDGQLFPETEGFMLAIQDQVIATRNYKKYIIKDPSVTDDNCRKCHLQKETIEHITSACKILAGTEYTARHNAAAKVVHQGLAITNKLTENRDPYYNYTPTSVLENDQYKLYWDVEIHTDKTIPANRPDIVFQSKADKITYLIDIAIPNDNNIQTSYAGKISKYTDLAIEIKRLWKQNKVIIVPLIMSVTGLTPNTFTPHLQQLGLDEKLHKTFQKSTHPDNNRQAQIQVTTKTIIEISDTLKQKLSLYAARLRRYNESNDRKDANNLFQKNEKQFYRNITANDQTTTMELPGRQELTEFWRNLWSEPKIHDEKALWIRQEEERHQHIPEQGDVIVTAEELAKTIKHTHNWKCPGVDNVQNFWYKQFSTTYEMLAGQINEAIRQPNRLPKFLTQGITYIKPKNADTKNPANYRPITCLPTLYKIITATICRSIEQHLTQNNILTEEQKGCRKQSQGCKEQLIIDTVIMEQTRKENRNLHTCFIDYKKAFDSVPHSWLIKILRIYKINPGLRLFLTKTMESWRTNIHLKTQEGHIQTDELHIRRGIFQGDSLSSLWFCLCLNPLSNTLNSTKYGFDIRHQRVNQHKINHLLYMDDIKLYAATEVQLRELLKITEACSSDIRMEFGMSKCKVLHINKGQWKSHPEQEILTGQTLDNMDKDEVYKYLGFNQNAKIDHTQVKTKLTHEFRDRLIKLLKTKLNSRNLTKAINTFAIPVLTYSFGIIKWSHTDIENIHILIRTQFTKHRMSHPNTCKERLTIDRKQGGRGIIDIQSLHTSQIKTLRHFFLSKQTDLHKAIVKADKNYTPLTLSRSSHAADTHSHMQSQQNKINTWAQKVLHGKHRYHITQDHINEQLSYTWLQDGQLFPETEGFMLAIQDQVIATCNYKKCIIKDPSVADDNCRKCHQQKETIDHITSGCRTLAGSEYIARHNSAAKVIHQALATTNQLIENNDPYYNYTPTSVLENNQYKLYWDVEIHTDKTIPANRPDIVFQSKADRVTYLIDIAIPNDKNIQNTYTGKISKYTDLAIEIKRLWKQNKVIIVPLIMSVSGLTPNTFTPHLKQLGLDEKSCRKELTGKEENMNVVLRI
nr:unnamed protein product [Callosobruchus analis]